MEPRSGAMFGTISRPVEAFDVSTVENNEGQISHHQLPTAALLKSMHQ